MVVAGQTATSRNDFANERAKAQDRQNSKRGKRSNSARKGGGVRKGSPRTYLPGRRDKAAGEWNRTAKVLTCAQRLARAL